MADQQMRQHSRVCKHCSQQFQYSPTRGRHPQHCSAKCRYAHGRELSRRSKESWPKCSCGSVVRARQATKCSRCYTAERKSKAGVCTRPQCRRPATRSGGTLCEVHYYRKRRTGRFDLPPPSTAQTHSHGYVIRKAPQHPLAGKTGWVFEHRLVAYDKYGDGPHPCHWCGVSLMWPDIVVDHLNEKKTDNRPGNLVVACSPCNRARGSMVSFIRRMQEHRIADLIETFDYMRCVEATDERHPVHSQRHLKS